MGILKSLSSWVVNGLKDVVNRLPDSPFTFDVPPLIADLLGYVNYFVPIKQMLTILSAWAACVLVWYFATVFLRWLKAIE